MSFDSVAHALTVITPDNTEDHPIGTGYNDPAFLITRARVTRISKLGETSWFLEGETAV